jgi:hypothetical protein
MERLGHHGLRCLNRRHWPVQDRNVLPWRWARADGEDQLRGPPEATGSEHLHAQNHTTGYIGLALPGQTADVSLALRLHASGSDSDHSRPLAAWLIHATPQCMKSNSPRRRRRRVMPCLYSLGLRSPSRLSPSGLCSHANLSSCRSVRTPPLSARSHALHALCGQGGRADLHGPGLHQAHAHRIVRVRVFPTSHVQSPAEISRVL